MRRIAKSWLFAAALALPLVGLSGVASAQGAGPAPSKALKRSANSGDCARAAKRGKACKIEFKTGDDVEGGVASGTGTQINAIHTVTHSSLIRLRTSFRDMIIRTGDRF